MIQLIELCHRMCSLLNCNKLKNKSQAYKKHPKQPYLHYLYDLLTLLIVIAKQQQNQFILQLYLMKYSQHEEEDYDDNYLEYPPFHNKPQKRKHKPIAANLIDTQYQVVEQVCFDLDYNVVIEKDLKNWDLKWTDSAVSVELLSKLQSHQKINHFPGMNTLSRKNNLAKNMIKMQNYYPEHYSYIPKTFLLPTDLGLLRTYYNQSRRKGQTKTFIVKPQASCQGRGIFLSQSLSQIQSYGQCVVQTYIDNPLLYKGLKFDLRIYALVASCDPLRIYIYNEGLVRFATQKYQPAEEQNLQNLYMHLTNYAINKDSPKYVFNQSLQNLSHGHKKSLAEFFQTLKGQGLPAHEYWSGIKDIIVKTMITGQPHLQHEYRMAQPHNVINNMCFEILGFDFMIDDRNKVYLLEINYTPSFSTETPLDHLIKSNLIRDTLVLMNVTPQARNTAQKLAKEQLQRRVFTGKMTKVSPTQREILINQFQKDRDQYQKKHLGSFERIYPSRNPDRQAKYLSLLDYSAEQYKQASSPKKSLHGRRSNSKYRIKRLVSNHTFVEDQGRQNDTNAYRNNRNSKEQMQMNPELKEKSPVFARKLREKLSYNNSIKQTINYGLQERQFSKQGQQIRAMDLGSLKTKNEQSTMFSKHYGQQTQG